MMRCYHPTNAADRIQRTGFVDAEDFYMTQTLHTGVWVSDVPLGVNEGARGRHLITLDLPDDVFAEYEWVEEGKPYLEALIPAAVLNLGTIVDVEESDDWDW